MLGCERMKKAAQSRALHMLVLQSLSFDSPSEFRMHSKSALYHVGRMHTWNVRIAYYRNNPRDHY